MVCATANEWALLEADGRDLDKTEAAVTATIVAGDDRTDHEAVLRAIDWQSRRQNGVHIPF